MLQKKLRSMGYALKGLKTALRQEHNFQFELVLAVAAVVLGLYFQLSDLEWLFVIGAIGFVLCAELFNTALEELCDMLRQTHDPHVEKIKDLSAAAVLVSALTALIIGCVIFAPYVL